MSVSQQTLKWKKKLSIHSIVVLCYFPTQGRTLNVSGILWNKTTRVLQRKMENGIDMQFQYDTLISGWNYIVPGGIYLCMYVNI